MFTVKTGCVVVSTAGHDVGQLFAVVAEDGNYVLLCDGKERKISTPKRKNKKHIALTSSVLPDTALKTDRQLRAFLSSLKTAKGGA